MVRHIEENRKLELISEAIADLLDPRRPIRLAEGDGGNLGFSTPQRADTREPHPEHQEQGERDFDENGQEDGAD